MAVRRPLILGQQFQQRTIGGTPYLQHAGLQCMNAITAAGELHAHRVDQEWHVRMQYLDHAMGRLPAMFLVVRVEHLHFRHGWIEALQEAPAGQRRTDQVAHAPLGELGQRDDTEELLGKDAQLRQDLGIYVLCQCGLQLLLKVGLAGR